MLFGIFLSFSKIYPADLNGEHLLTSHQSYIPSSLINRFKNELRRKMSQKVQNKSFIIQVNGQDSNNENLEILAIGHNSGALISVFIRTEELVKPMLTLHTDNKKEYCLSDTRNRFSVPYDRATGQLTAEGQEYLTGDDKKNRYLIELNSSLTENAKGSVDAITAAFSEVVEEINKKKRTRHMYKNGVKYAIGISTSLIFGKWALQSFK